MKRAALAVSVALVCAGAAAALSVHSGTVSIPRGKRGTAVATCPPPTTVRLTGLKATVGEHANLELNALIRSGRRAIASAVNPERPGTGSLTVFAYCGRGPGLRTVAADTTLAPTEQGSVTATCPAGTSVAFGGFRADAGPAPAPHYAERFSAIYPASMMQTGPRSWTVSGHKFVPVIGKLTAIAYCR